MWTNRNQLDQSCKARDSYWKAHNELIDKLDSRPVTRFDYFFGECFEAAVRIMPCPHVECVIHRYPWHSGVHEPGKGPGRKSHPQISGRRLPLASTSCLDRHCSKASAPFGLVRPIKGLTPHASFAKRDCVGGDNPVVFYVPLLEYPRSGNADEDFPIHNLDWLTADAIPRHVHRVAVRLQQTLALIIFLRFGLLSRAAVPRPESAPQDCRPERPGRHRALTLP